MTVTTLQKLLQRQALRHKACTSTKIKQRFKGDLKLYGTRDYMSIHIHDNIHVIDKNRHLSYLEDKEDK